MKSHKKDSIHPIALSPNISSLENKTKSPLIFICRKQIFVIFNDCQDVLQNVDEIIGQPFPINRVFNWRLTNFEVGFILQPFF